jgi:hypothetical protein
MNRTVFYLRILHSAVVHRCMEGEPLKYIQQKLQVHVGLVPWLKNQIDTHSEPFNFKLSLQDGIPLRANLEAAIDGLRDLPCTSVSHSSISDALESRTCKCPYQSVLGLLGSFAATAIVSTRACVVV